MNHDGPGPEIFLLSMPSWYLGTVEARQERAGLIRSDLVVTLIFAVRSLQAACAPTCAGRVRRGEQRQRDAGQGYEQAD